MEKKQKMVFREYFENLSIEDKAKLRNSILDKTGMGYSTFYAKLSGARKFPILEEAAIKELVPNIELVF